MINKLSQKLISILILFVLLIQVNGQSDLSKKSKINGTWSNIDFIFNPNGEIDYNDYLREYRELKFDNSKLHVYNLLEDSTIQLSYENMTQSDFEVILNDSVQTKLRIKYQLINNKLILDEKTNTSKMDTFNLIEDSEIILSKNILKYIKSENQKSSWCRFHNYLNELNLISVKELNTVTKNWEKEVFGIISGDPSG